MNALRFVDGASNVIEGLLVPFGGSFDGKDSYGTYASRQTDFCLDMFPPGARPLMFDHGLDAAVRTSPIGRITSLEVRDAGVWMKAQLDKRNTYFSEIKSLIENDALGLSSGAMAHLVEIDDDTGEWKRWPIVEGSATPTEANLLATIPVHSFASAIRSAGFEDVAKTLDDAPADSEIVEFDAMRATLDAAARDKLSDADFAYIDSNGGRHLPIHDAAHVKAAMARFNQTSFESDAKKAAAKKKILARAKALGIEVSPDSAVARSSIRQVDDESSPTPESSGGETSMVEKSFEDIRDDITALVNGQGGFGPMVYTHVLATYPDHVIVCRHDGDMGSCDDGSLWSVAYTLDADDDPVLGASTEVEQAYVPAQRTASAPLSLDASRFILDAVSLGQRTKDLSERRIREGRVISAPNRQILMDAHAAMGQAHQTLGDLLDRTNREAEAVARAANPDTWTSQLAELTLLEVTL